MTLDWYIQRRKTEIELGICERYLGKRIFKDTKNVTFYTWFIGNDNLNWTYFCFNS